MRPRLKLRVKLKLKLRVRLKLRVKLKLKRPDHRILTRSQSLPERTDKAHVLFTVGRELLGREIGGHKSYRLLGIGADQLGPPGESDLLALADEGTSRRDNLEAAIDDLHARLGEDALQSGRQFTRKHRPERDATRQRPSIESLSGPDDGDQQC